MKYLKIAAQWIGKAFEPIRLNATFFVTMYVLGLLCSWIEMKDKPQGYANLWLELFFDLYLVCLLLTLLPLRVRRWVRRVLYVLFYGLAVVDAFCIVKFQSPITPTMLLLVGETTGKEAGEFLTTYLSADVLLSPLGWILLLMVVHAVCTKVVKLKLKNSILKPQTSILKPQFSILTPLAGLLTIVLFCWSAYASWPNKQAFWRLMSLEKIGYVEHELTRKDRATLYEPVYRLAFSMRANSLTARQIDQLIETKDRVSVDSCSFTSPNIVLIIGESYNKYHSQLYGYEKETTPWQLKRRQRGELQVFTDVVAPWNLTSFVFKHLFSLYAVGDTGEWCDYPLFTEVFRKAGYHVTFLTNQFLPKAKEAVYDFSGGFFLNNPELSAAQFDSRNEHIHVFDEKLIDDYRQLVSNGEIKPDKPELTIYHLYGQHVDYRIRCPKSRMRFKPSDYDRPRMSRRNLQVLAYYDNAVMYNDSVVDAILRVYEDQDAIVMYVPDHGEEVFGPGAEHFFGRMHSTEITARLAREEFEIPMWMWCSHKYMVNHPEIANQVVMAKNRRLMIDALPHTLLYLGGIHTRDYRERLNVLVPEYDEQRPRILKATTDYDEIMNKNKKDNE
ncbi:MAG: sulfatase-like hydrolase/transferase [Prevotella sp.]|nr:sulfatase-like hydrolase/transferase [Prevotella sp.]